MRGSKRQRLAATGAGALALATAVVVASPGAAPGGAVAAGATIEAIGPVRLTDTRPGEPTIDGLPTSRGPVAADTDLRIQVTGRAGIPDNTAAVFLNVTAVNPTAPGYLFVYDCTQPRPTGSHVNYNPGDIAPNAVLAQLSPTGELCIYTLATTHLIVDLNGTVPTGASVTPTTPTRLTDTRPGEPTIDGLPTSRGPVAADTDLRIQVTGRAGIPDNTAAVFLNVTAVNPTTPGYLFVYDCTQPRPTGSHVNYNPGDIAPNAVLAQLSPTGELCIYTLATTHLIVDLNGTVPTGASVTPTTPTRLTDTRPGEPTIDGLPTSRGPVAADTDLRIQVTGRAGIPDNTAAVFLNVTAVNPTTPGYHLVYDCTQPRPTGSHVNYNPGDIAPNAVLAQLSPTGELCIYTLATTHLIVDLNGTIAGPEVGPTPTPTATPTPTPTPGPGGFPDDTVDLPPCATPNCRPFAVQTFDAPFPLTDPRGTYWAFVGEPAEQGRPYALLVWLHGCGGQSEGDLWNVGDWWEGPADPHYIAIAPDGAEGRCWLRTADWDRSGPGRVLTAIADAISRFEIDPAQVVLAGYSSGGDLAYRTGFFHADQVAGVLAVNSSPFRDTRATAAEALAAATRKFPIEHLAHVDDDTYPIAGVRNEIQQLVDAGWDAHLTERPGTHYDAADPDGPGPGKPTDVDTQDAVLDVMSRSWSIP